LSPICSPATSQVDQYQENIISSHLSNLKLIFLPSLHLQNYPCKTCDNPKEPHCALVHLCSHKDLGHVGPGQGGHEVSYEIDELDGDELSIFINVVDPFQELHGGHLLELFFEVGLLLETFPELDDEGDDLPDDAEEEDRVADASHDAVGGVADHHHDHGGVVEKQEQRNEDVA
jgi:hypothetical protein